jgi:outer membrane murein-binding lipoprotein Lpp
LRAAAPVKESLYRGAVRIVVAAIVTAALLGGCASPRGKTAYEKAGAGEEQKKIDEAQCAQAALDTAGPRAAAYLAVDRDAVDRCMQARGYRVTAPR